jgi:GNAT superfamily N-acetyltransferase
VLSEAIRLAMAGVLVVSSVAKLASPSSTRAALATFGVVGELRQRVAWTLLVAGELALAAGVAAGSPLAAYLAAGLMAAFAGALALALQRGRAGAPCACFGARSRVSTAAVGRNVLLAAGFLLTAILPSSSLTTEQWLGLGLGVALIAIVGLAAAVLALAREVGMLRLRLGPDAALEIPEEGPEIGERSALIDRFQPGPAAELALAVFVSEGCRACQSLEPAIASLATEPAIAVETFAEGGDPAAWTEARVPGSPFAVALALDGTVLAKGTFNNLAQLESVLGTAERRRSVLAPAGVPDG